jgi:hypothetical protein
MNNKKKITKKNKLVKRAKTIKRSRKNKSIKNYKGSGKEEIKKTTTRDNFRNMFTKNFEKLMKTEITNNKNDIDNIIMTLKNGFKSNQIGINSLIPVTNNYIPIDKYKYTSNTPIIGIVPPIATIIYNLKNIDNKKTIITSFIENKGNINLQSIKGNITALSCAIKTNDREIVQFLIKNGADKNLLDNNDLILLEKILQEEEKENVIQQKPLEIPISKLDFSIEPNENEYISDSEPTFWKNIFKNNEMKEIKEKINNMMNSDNNIPIVNREATKLWSLCEINKAIIPTYYVPTKNEPYELFGTYISDKDLDFSHYNIILCASLLIYGIISEKMKGQDYKLIFKGGKAIQLVLTGIPNMNNYITEDIDILLVPNHNNVIYQENIVKNLAGHICYLIKWFLNMHEQNFNISVKAPVQGNPNMNPYIYKLSYIKNTKKYDYRKNGMVDDFRQFSDVDFKDIPKNIKDFFENTVEFKFYISEFDNYVVFRCPNIGSLLDEKIYYYSKYMKFLNVLKLKGKIEEPGYEKLNIIECGRIMEKFKRAILAMNTGLQKKRFINILPDELIIKEKQSISTRLSKFNDIDENLKQQVLQSLYSN